MRTDLGMTSGKIAAQYASPLPYRRSRSNNWPSLGAREHSLALPCDIGNVFF